ncbi:hypothetical protein AYI70_g8943 [Smittium culicis]|uniref:Hexosyltransferase n=1 Tax=Smittium culicis TaxID=133412 RepID=A0A1R1XDK9_9FUNG|nr:hypothetical protein AYI70_g8943 [Smittium culicis]
MSKEESISYLKNVYSDLNIVTLCDFDDKRSGCDHHLPKNYTYDNLNEKMFDIFNYTCRNFPGYKVYAKMDFDAYVNKSYATSVLKFMIDNSEKRIYYGNPFKKSENIVFMGGHFYAFTVPLLNNYCKCNVKKPEMFYEDEWLGHTLNNCTRLLNNGKSNLIHYMYMEEDKILHKEARFKGVKLDMGHTVYENQK